MQPCVGTDGAQGSLARQVVSLVVLASGIEHGMLAETTLAAMHSAALAVTRGPASGIVPETNGLVVHFGVPLATLAVLAFALAFALAFQGLLLPPGQAWRRAVIRS